MRTAVASLLVSVTPWIFFLWWMYVVIKDLNIKWMLNWFVQITVNCWVAQRWSWVGEGGVEDPTLQIFSFIFLILSPRLCLTDICSRQTRIKKNWAWRNNNSTTMHKKTSTHWHPHTLQLMHARTTGWMLTFEPARARKHPPVSFALVTLSFSLSSLCLSSDYIKKRRESLWDHYLAKRSRRFFQGQQKIVVIKRQVFVTVPGDGQR